MAGTGQIIKPPTLALIPLGARAATVRNIDSTKNPWFGPLEPLKPMAPAGTQPRQWDYQPGQNLIWQPRAQEGVSYEDLLYMADNCDLVRIVIEGLKDIVCAARWQIRVIEKQGESKKQNGERQASDPRIQKWTEFFRWPNPEHDWSQWLRLLLEDLLVLDAPSILLQRARNQKIGALRVIDGSTINRIIDENGFTPLAPDPAYQQILVGQPAVELTTDDLVYRPRVIRTRKMYGFGPVEQILTTLNIATRRMRFQLNAYTEGNVPEALYTMPASVTEEQVKRFQGWFDQQLQGNLAARRRIWFIPGDDKGVNRLHWTKEQLIKDEADEWFARVICYAFRMSPNAFIRMLNRATSQQNEDSAEEQGVRSVQEWVAGTINYIIQKKAGDADLEFAFVRKQDADPLKQAQTDEIYLRTGKNTINEIREKNGEDPSDDPMCDRHGIITGTGFTPLDQVEKQNAAAEQQQTYSQTSGDRNFEHTVKQADRAHDLVVQSQKDRQQQQTGKALAGGGLRKNSKLRIETDDHAVDAHQIAALEQVFKSFLAEAGNAAAEAVAKHWGINKADKPKDAETVVDIALDAIDWTRPVHSTEESLAAAGQTGASIGVGQLRLSHVGLISRVSETAREFAHRRAAELVGKQWRGDKLIDNPNAAYRIDKTTRDELRALVEKAFSEETRMEDLVEKIREAGTFGESRAKTIARTEVARAQSLGTYDVWKAAGSVKTVTWDVSVEGPCDLCQKNADAGAIPFGEAFPSGDVAPPGHPACRCALIAEDLEDPNAAE